MEQKLPKRQEVPEALTWRLEDIYADRRAWEADLKEAQELGDKIAGREGSAATSAAALLETLQLYDRCMRKAHSTVGYANMLHDQDTGDALGQEMDGKARSALVRIEETTAFLEPEILQIPDELLESYYREETGLELISIEDELHVSYGAVGFSNEKNVCIVGKAKGEFHESTSAEEEIQAGWDTKEEVRELLQTEYFSARTQAYSYLWSKE